MSEIRSGKLGLYGEVLPFDSTWLQWVNIGVSQHKYADDSDADDDDRREQWRRR